MTACPLPDEGASLKTLRQYLPGDDVIQLAIRLGLLAFLVYWTFVLIRPFVPILAWSIVLAVALYPAASVRLASSGVVDMFRTDRPSHRVQLYRLRDSATETLQWHIGQSGNRRLLTKASLEAELDTILRL